MEIVIPESVGIPSSALLKLLEELEKIEYLNSLILMRHGKRCLECFVKPYSRDMPHQLFSLSKSFTSCAIGLAQAEGKLKISDKLISFFPEYTDRITDDRMRDVSLRDLLTMQSGHLDCAKKYFKTSDWVGDYLASPLDTDPGAVFAYNSGATYMLAAVIRRVSGENVREYLQPRLLAPLGITPGIWECCPMGTNCGGWGLYLTTDDIAAFAQLLLQHGKWNNKQVLPEDYCREATQKHADNSMNTLADWQEGYGYQFWRSRHGYRGDGASGQYAIVLEQEDIAIAVTGCMENMECVLTAIWEIILPELSDKNLPEDKESLQKLYEKMNSMAIPVASSNTIHANGWKNFEFKPNHANINHCSVVWNSELCTLTFAMDGRCEQLRAGFNKFAYSSFQLTDDMAHPVAAFAHWENDHTLKVCSFILDGTYRDIWTIDLSNTVEPMKNTEVCACFRNTKPRFILK